MGRKARGFCLEGDREGAVRTPKHTKNPLTSLEDREVNAEWFKAEGVGGFRASEGLGLHADRGAP